MAEGASVSIAARTSALAPPADIRTAFSASQLRAIIHVHPYGSADQAHAP